MKIAIVSRSAGNGPAGVVGKMTDHEDLSDRGMCFISEDGISFTTMDAFIAKMPSDVSQGDIDFLKSDDFDPVGCLNRPILPVLTEHKNSVAMYFRRNDDGDIILAGVANGPAFDLDRGTVMEMQGSGSVEGFETLYVSSCLSASEVLDSIDDGPEGDSPAP